MLVADSRRRLRHVLRSGFFGASKRVAVIAGFFFAIQRVVSTRPRIILGVTRCFKVVQDLSVRMG